MTEKETIENVEVYKEKLEAEKKGLKGLFAKFKIRNYPFTAQSCFIQSKYGEGSYCKPEDRIKDKQENIRNAIESKFAVDNNRLTRRVGMFHCIIDIEEDLTNYVDEIFKPFVQGGFEIINLSEKCKDIDTGGVYYISWKNAFKEK